MSSSSAITATGYTLAFPTLSRQRSRKNEMEFDTGGSSRIEQAWAMAARLHKEQRRKGGDIPYIRHLEAVADIVREHGGSEDQIIAALLHDGPEDVGGLRTLEEICDSFGPHVARLVEDCSDSLSEDPKNKEAWGLRKERYIQHVRGESAAESLLVSLADKIHNLRSISEDQEALGEEIWNRFSRSKYATLWYYRALLVSFEGRAAELPEALLEEMRQMLLKLEAGAQVLAPIAHQD